MSCFWIMSRKLIFSWMLFFREQRSTNHATKGSGCSSQGDLCMGIFHRVSVLTWLFSVSLTCSQGATPSVADPSVRRDATVRAVERVMPSVVNIRTEILLEQRDFYYDLLWDFFGPHYRRRPAESTYSLGSGVMIHPSGYVLTNAHVIRRASRVEVILQDGTRYEAEPVAGMRSSDVALLKIRQETSQVAFKTIAFADADDLFLGETVLALGNPFGLGSSVSRGILSSKNRRPSMGDEPLEIEDWLQTDAAINPGNSGGPLINLEGAMIGLNVAVFKEGQGIGFAIPVKRVNEAIAEIMTPEVMDGLWFGARLDAVDGSLRIKQVIKSSPAEKAGFQVGDIVNLINGKSVVNAIECYLSLTAEKGKTTINVEVQREGSRRQLQLKLIPEEVFFNAQLIRQRTGLLLQKVTPSLARHLNLDAAQGFIVAELEAGGASSESGMQPGLIVTHFNAYQADTLLDLAKFLHTLDPGEEVRLQCIVQRRTGRFLTLNRANARFTLR